MFIPFLIIVPGIIALVLSHDPGKGFVIPPDASGGLNYNLTIIMLLKQYLPTGVLGLGITALLASFMSGMAGNVSAFNTVWTYDIYQSYIRPRTSDEEADGKHYLKVGRIATVFGILLSIASAYVASKFGNIMDFLQTIFSLISAPLFAVIFLGMFWKRTTGHAAFTGLLLGFLMALLHHGLTTSAGATSIVKGGWITTLHIYPVEMAQNFWTAIIAFGVSTIVTVGLTFMTKQQKSDEELTGLVYSLTPRTIVDKDLPWYQRPVGLAILVSVIFLILTVIFW
jgi:SSS family solute:Na+ symporter